MKSDALVLRQIVGDGDVRRAQQRGGLGLANQPIAGFGVGVDVVGEKLQRDAAPEALVFGQIHLAHAAAAEPLENVIVEDRRSDHPSACFAARYHLSIILAAPMPTLVRRLGLWSSIGIVIGITIGGGIFRTPGRHRDARAGADLDAFGLDHRRAGGPVRRAGVRRAGRVDARNRRHVRLPARRMGPARTPLSTAGRRRC